MCTLFVHGWILRNYQYKSPPTPPKHFTTIRTNAFVLSFFIFKLHTQKNTTRLKLMKEDTCFRKEEKSKEGDENLKNIKWLSNQSLEGKYTKRNIHNPIHPFLELRYVKDGYRGVVFWSHKKIHTHHCNNP